MKKLIYSCLLLASAQFASADAISEIMMRDVIKIGVLDNNFPFSYEDDKQNPQGFNVEIGRYLTKYLLGDESKVEFVFLEDIDRTPALLSGKVDLVIANYRKTALREKKVKFGSSYMQVALGVVSPKAAPIRSLDELDGKTIAVRKGTSAEFLFKENYKNVKILTTDSNAGIINAIEDGKAVAGSHNDLMLLGLIKEKPEFELTIPEIEGQIEEIAPAVKKGERALLDWMNSKIKSMKTDGSLRVNYEKNLAPLYGPNKHNILLAK